MRPVLILSIIFFFSCNGNPAEKLPQPMLISTEDSLRMEIRQYPDSAVLFENLLQYYREAGKVPKAMGMVDSVLQGDSLIPRLWDIKSILYLEQGDTSDAQKCLEKAIAILPAPEYVISLGALYAASGDQRALAMADALLLGNKAQADKEAYFIKGLYYSNLNQKEKAIPFFDEAISVNYTFMQAYLEKGIALMDLKKYSDAVMVLDKAVHLQNNYDEAWYYLGLAYEKLNRKDDAANAFQRALLYDPNYTEAAEALKRVQ